MRPGAMSDSFVPSEASDSKIQQNERRVKSTAREAVLLLPELSIHLDQTAELGLSDEDVETYATIMAETLAAMHWEAGVDAGDVEFVLGAPCGTAPGSREDRRLRDHVLRVFDFDLCTAIAKTDQGMEEAALAFLRNDPYFPRPGQGLWGVFRRAYLYTSPNLIRGDREWSHLGLPAMFLTFVVDIQDARCG